MFGLSFNVKVVTFAVLSDTNRLRLLDSSIQKAPEISLVTVLFIIGGHVLAKEPVSESGTILLF